MQTLSMIGVEEQMALLRESLCPTNGVPRLLCVSGQRGTGKSTAVAEVLSSVAPGNPIARLNTTEWLSHPARSVYASVLDQLCAAGSDQRPACPTHSSNPPRFFLRPTHSNTLLKPLSILHRHTAQAATLMCSLQIPLNALVRHTAQ